MFAWCFQPKIVIFTLNMLLVNNIYFSEDNNNKDQLTHSLHCNYKSEWLNIYLSAKKPTYEVTGDVCLVFPTKTLLYSLLIYY